MRIAVKLYLGFGILIGLLVLLGALVAYDLGRIHQRLGHLSQIQMPSLRADLDTSRNFTSMVSQAHIFLVSGEHWRYVSVRSARLLVNRSVRQEILASSSAAIPLQAKTQVQMLRLENSIDTALTLARSGRRAQAMSYWDRVVTPLAESLEPLVDYVSRLQEDSILGSTDYAFAQAESLRRVNLAVILLALLTAVLAAGVIARSTLSPIREFVRVVDQVSGGDLAARVDWPALDELGSLARDFNRMADRVESTISELQDVRVTLQERNEALQTARRLMQNELDIAAHIQREILPRQCGHMDIAADAHMESARDIGGDFYDSIPLGPGSDSLVVVVGDVSGKGIAAALLMVFVVTLIREICRRDTNPARVLHALNRVVRSRFSSDEEMYVTCFLGSLNRKTLEFSFAKAGHEEPIWLHRETGQAETLSAPGLFIGLFTDGLYEQRSVQLAPGDRLVLYTDGIVEARNAAREFFGVDRLRRLVEECGAATASAIIDRVKSAVAEWTNDSVLADDMTILVIEAPEGESHRDSSPEPGLGSHPVRISHTDRTSATPAPAPARLPGAHPGHVL
jgi:serine phosphatase RsbU (regulator of sigma subunit)